MRVAGPGTPTYDIAIDSITVANVLHAGIAIEGTHPAALYQDADHIYFAVAGQAADGANPYNASYDDGQTNYFNSMWAKSTVPYNSATSPFVLSGLVIDPSDTLSFSVMMDSRTSPELAGLSAFQSQLVGFAAARAFSFMTGSTMDREAVPWDSTSDPTPVDTNNFPIWIWPDGYGDQALAGPIAAKIGALSQHCDGYTGDLHFSKAGSDFTDLSGKPDGSSFTFTETLTGDLATICWDAAYPKPPAGIPNARAKATITFRATVHQHPYPDLSGNVCVPGPLTPVPLGGAPDAAWVGHWVDPDYKVQVRISPDPDQGLDVLTTEAQTACNTSAPLAPLTGSAGGLADGPVLLPDWTGTLPSPCVSQPPSPGVKELLDLNSAQSLSFDANGKTWLELFTYTCAGSSQPLYKVRYARTTHYTNVFVDYMLDLKQDPH
jgi:hypothetical protein